MLTPLFLYISEQKGNLKMDGSARFLRGTGGKIGLNVEKWTISQDLSKEFFQFVPDTLRHPLYTFSNVANPSSLKKH